MKNRVGEKHITNEGYEIEIIEYITSKNCTIRFTSGLIMRKVNYDGVNKGSIKNPYHPAVYGAGYIGVGEYNASLNRKCCKIYNTWTGMLERVYSKKYQSKKTTYIDTNICEQWHNFQNFAEWFEENYNPEFMKGWHLDKDILFKGNKIYSPETCCFVPQEINTLFTKSNKTRGEYPIGVTKHGNGFRVILNMQKKLVRLGTFNTAEEAFQVYKTTKEKYIKEVANFFKQLISNKVYETMTNYEVEITD